MSGYQSYNQKEYTGNNYEGGFNRSGNNMSGSSQSRTSSSGNRLRTVTPVTIKQIEGAEQQVADGPFVINNLEIDLVSFVGIVRNITDNTTNLLIRLEDGTGSFEFRKWSTQTLSEGDDDGHTSHGDNEQQNENEIELGKYIHVIGSLTEFGQKKNLQYPTVKPVPDYSEVLYHYLSAIKAHADANGVRSNVDAKNNGESSALFVSEPTKEELSIGDKIFNLIKENTPTMPDGVPIQFIAQGLNLPINDVVEQCNILEENARVYNGVDDSAFLAV